MGNRREPSCTTDDQNTWCWLVPPVWRQALARKDTFQPSQRVHTGARGRKVTHTPWGQQHSNSVIQQFPLCLHALSDIWAPWKCVERGVHRKCTSANEGLKIFSLFLGFSCFFLQEHVVRCHTTLVKGSVCMTLRQHQGDWDQCVMRLLGRAAAETGSGACWRYLWRAGCRELG